MYINFWYPICLSDELTDSAPVSARVLGLTLVSFRDRDGKAHVLANTCPHRGGSLGKGRIVDGRLACPYHGWQFDGTGRCARVPSLGDEARPPARAKVDSYPVIERYGIVFAFLGDLPEGDRIPFYDIPEWDQPGWRPSGLVVFELDAYYERSMENGLDPAHNEFVHKLQGNIRFRPETASMAVETWGTRGWIRMDQPPPGTIQLEFLTARQEGDTGGSGYHHGPNILVTTINLSRTNTLVQFFFEQPVDENHTRIFFINLRNCMLDPQQDARMAQLNMAVADEDIRVITELSPKRTPSAPGRELLGVGDEFIAAYRRHLKNWEGRGWRIDYRKLRETAGDVAYAIPCPGRRESGNWVLDPVPLV